MPGHKMKKMGKKKPAKGKKKSQIDEYLDFYDGPGVQHVALLTSDIIKTIKKLKENGIEFLEVPDTYYEDLTKRVGAIDEDIEVLRKLKIYNLHFYKY